VNPSIRVNCLAPISNYYRDQTSRQYGSLCGLGMILPIRPPFQTCGGHPVPFGHLLWNTNVPMTSYVYLTNTSDGSASFVWKKTQLGSFPTNAGAIFQVRNEPHASKWRTSSP
jgi:hypothetical protein